MPAVIKQVTWKEISDPFSVISTDGVENFSATLQDQNKTIGEKLKELTSDSNSLSATSPGAMKTLVANLQEGDRLLMDARAASRLNINADNWAIATVVSADINPSAKGILGYLCDVQGEISHSRRKIFLHYLLREIDCGNIILIQTAPVSLDEISFEVSL